jgi:hypothetical protein
MEAKILLLAALISAAAAADAAQLLSGSTDPNAPVSGVQYESVFSTYRPHQEPAIAPWRDVNDEVARVGGHVGITGGAGAHGAHGKDPAKPATVTTEGGQPPLRSAPKAPAGGAHTH